MKDFRLSGLCSALALVFALGIGGAASNVFAVDPVQIILNNDNMTLTHETAGNRDATYTDPEYQPGIDLPLHYKINDGDWNILWNVGTFPDQGTPILTVELGNNAGDILTLGATSQGDNPSITGGDVTQDSSTEISVAWDDTTVTGTFPNGGDPFTIVFTDVVTNLSVSGGTVTYEQPCGGDFAPFDGDVDGSDLAALMGGSTGISLADFASEFGRMDCPVS